MKLQYEFANETDIPMIYGLTKHLIDTYENVESVDYEFILEWVRQKIERNVFKHQHVVADGQLCGYFYLCEDGELDLLYVLPEFQNRGIGSEVLKKCIADSENSMYLYVFTRNTGARSLYERFGFTVRETVGKSRLIMARNG